MKLDISPKEFQALSTTKKKKYIARLLIKESKAQPVAAESRPIAFVMAGLPGAGKTEFLDTLTEMINHLERWMPFVRIDLDQIVTVYPDYSPKDYYKFRSDGNRVLAWSVDEARHGRYNMMIDGTFSGKSGASVDTIGNLLDSGYIVQLVYLYDSAETAWNYTLKREKETARGVSKARFIEACRNIIANLKKARDKYSDNKNFRMIAVVQKELRDKNYDITTENAEIDKILHKPYNLENIKDAT